ncbi:MAG: bifunctional 2-polyprenyl-6-hydroxyphenol methylase/3-demethylubiquinol 3-O-methyltransferase UbiG [Pseudomonadota bacterium]
MNSPHPESIEPFERLGDQWWDLQGPLRTLHHINPCRLGYLLSKIDLEDQRVLDVGCGGGILSEALAQQGALVTGLDAAPSAIAAATAHATQANLPIHYQCLQTDAYLKQGGAPFPIVVCFELIEHVADPAALMADLSALTCSGGDVFVSTLNRTPKAFLQAILGAEYVFNLIPKGTHQFKQFIKPSELIRLAEQAGLECLDLEGMSYNPLTRQATLCRDVTVNYFAHFKKPHAKS